MVEEVSGALKERLSSNIVGTFTLSFSLANWRFFSYLFSDLPADAKITKAEAALYDYFLSCAIVASLITGIVLFLIPYIKVSYDKYFFEKAAQSELHKLSSEKFISGQISEFNGSLRNVLSKRNSINAILAQCQQLNSTVTTLNQVIQNHHGNGLLQVQSIDQQSRDINLNLSQLLNDFDQLKTRFEIYEKLIESLEQKKKNK